MRRLLLVISHLLCLVVGVGLGHFGLSRQRIVVESVDVPQVLAPRTVNLSPEVAAILNAKESMSEGEFEDRVLHWFKETYSMENENERK